MSVVGVCMFEMRDGSLPTSYGENVLITDIPLEETPMIPVSVELDVEPAATTQSEPEEVVENPDNNTMLPALNTDGIVNNVEGFTDTTPQISNNKLAFILIAVIIIIVIVVLTTCTGSRDVNINMAGNDLEETVGVATKYLNNGVINLF